MNRAEPVEVLTAPVKDDERRLEYSAYADQFDSMCELIPAYQENIDYLLDIVGRLELPEAPKVLDLGAGTGNFVLALHDLVPSADFVHLDSDPAMNRVAKSKYKEKGIEKVEIVEEFMQRATFEEDEFDLIVCVNSLNTAPPQDLVLKLINTWLKPDGKLYLIDFGRRQRLVDWTWYIFSNTVRRFGPMRFFSAFYENRQGLRQNRNATKDQDKGLMWLHTHEEFEKIVTSAGLVIEVSTTCYRDYCDLIVAHKGAIPP